jgi:hypothetical protein
MNTANAPQKATCSEVRLDTRRHIERALSAPKVIIPGAYTYAPKMKGSFSNASRLEFTTNDMKALGEALLAPAPAPNAKLIAAMKRAKKWK